MSAAPKTSVAQIEGYAKNFDMKKTLSHQKKVANTGFGEKFKTMVKMVGDRNFQIDPKTKLIYVGALAYTVMPFDAVPDYIPGLGLLDDAAVIKIVWDSSVNEVKRYLGLSR